MVVFECIVFGSLAAVVVSELYILKKLFTENNFPYVNNSPPAPITSSFGSRSEYAWQIKEEFSWRFDARTRKNASVQVKIFRSYKYTLHCNNGNRSPTVMLS